jgi:hypothetical protein
MPNLYRCMILYDPEIAVLRRKPKPYGVRPQVRHDIRHTIPRRLYVRGGGNCLNCHRMRPSASELRSAKNLPCLRFPIVELPGS